MTRSFVFRLDNGQLQKYRRQGRAMHIKAAILLLFYSLIYMLIWKQSTAIGLMLTLSALAILSVSILKPELIYQPAQNRMLRILEAGLLFMGCLSYLQHNQHGGSLIYGLTAGFMMLLLYLENRLLRDQHISFNQQQIELQLPMRDKVIQWSELQAVMIRNEFLTLSFKEGTIRQLRIYPDYSEQAAGDFLFFCKDCIAR